LSEPDGRRAIRHPVGAIDRRHAILERVAEEQTIHVGELARELGVSEMTIRRDIRRLERDGFLRQTYGGATAHLTRSLDLAFNSRALQHVREKRLIGMRATGLVADARVMFVGIGTTAEQFARYLTGRPELTVVTPSIPIASLLGTRPPRVVATGGDVRHDELSCVGPIASATVSRYRFDIAVVGAAALSARWGIGELTDAEAEVERVAIERCDRLVVMADGSKLGGTAPVVVCSADRIHTLVTDRSAPATELDRLAALGIEIVVADEDAVASASVQAALPA
jgi:DeoR/GlpR family transcriptional regulator of sugar metabolism